MLSYYKQRKYRIHWTIVSRKIRTTYTRIYGNSKVKKSSRKHNVSDEYCWRHKNAYPASFTASVEATVSKGVFLGIHLSCFSAISAPLRIETTSCCRDRCGHYDNGDARMRSTARRTASATSLGTLSLDNIRSTPIVANVEPSTDILRKFCNRRSNTIHYLTCVHL